MCEKDEKYSAFKRACIAQFNEEFEKYNEYEDCDFEFSKKFKKKLNRTGREKIGLKKVLHPEVDNTFERTRSKIIIWWKSRKK